MNKKTFTIKYNETPIYVGDIREMGIMDFLTAKREAEANLATLIADYHNLQDRVAELEKGYDELLKEIALLKGE